MRRSKVTDYAALNYQFLCSRMLMGAYTTNGLFTMTETSDQMHLFILYVMVLCGYLLNAPLLFAMKIVFQPQHNPLTSRRDSLIP